MGQFSTCPPHRPLPVRDPVRSKRHHGRVILVTGAAGGVGRATAELLAAEGARVALADIRSDALAAAVAAIGSEDAFAVPLDLADPFSIARAVAAAGARLGRIDGLVNCAAIVVHADPLETAWADWERIFRVNLFGAYEASRLVAKSMIASGARGAIVSYASEAGKKGHMESFAYSASKAALINMTRVLSAALAPHDINVNCVCPGGVATDMLRDAAVAYGKLVDAPPGEVFPQTRQRAVATAHRTRRSRPYDLLPFERRRPYHSRPGHQCGRWRHAVLGRAIAWVSVRTRHAIAGLR